MKITVEFSEKEFKEIQKLSDAKFKGAAIRQLALEALEFRKRRQLSEQVLQGEWSIEFQRKNNKQNDRSLWKT